MDYEATTTKKGVFYENPNRDKFQIQTENNRRRYNEDRSRYEFSYNNAENSSILVKTSSSMLVLSNILAFILLFLF